MVPDVGHQIDNGSTLTAEQYQSIIQTARQHGEAGLAQLNAGAAAGPRALFVPPGLPSATTTGVTECTLVPRLAAGRRGVIVVVRKEDRARMRKRKRVLPQGIGYQGDSFGGAITWEPAPDPLVAKRYGSWQRLVDENLTHQMVFGS